MKILLVVDQYDGANNGNTVTARMLAKTLEKHGHEVMIACGGDPAPYKFRFEHWKFPVFEKLVKSQGFSFAAPDEKMMRTAFEWADLVHVLMPFRIGRQAAIMAEQMGKPCTGAFHMVPTGMWSSVHLGWCIPLDTATYWYWKHYIYKHFHYVHCPSQMVKDELIKHHYNCDVHAISNGINSDFQYRKKEKTPELQGKFVIVMSGRFSKDKGHEYIMKAMRYSKHRDEIQLYFAGQGPIKEKLEKIAREENLNVIMRFHTRQELMDLFAMADLYVHSSMAETESLGCMEAFAAGLVPVIHESKRSATTQFALTEHNLFKFKDSKDLAAQIDWWIEHPEERREMEKKYAEYAKNFDVDKCVTKMEEMFQLEMDRVKGKAAN